MTQTNGISSSTQQAQSPDQKKLEMLRTKVMDEAIKLAHKKVGHIGYLVDYALQYETIISNGIEKRA